MKAHPDETFVVCDTKSWPKHTHVPIASQGQLEVWKQRRSCFYVSSDTLKTETCIEAFPGVFLVVEVEEVKLPLSSHQHLDSIHHLHSALCTLFIEQNTHQYKRGFIKTG